MKYRHSFHAGNFADVHKHVALCALLRAMQRKDKGFFYLDTHAGAGRYDLDSCRQPPRRRSSARRDSAHGCGRATAGRGAQELLRGDRRSCARACDSPHAYPGSPWLAAQLLRSQDRGLCCELLPAECRALERALGGWRRMRVACADGYEQLRAVLPPPERRCLVLIDPPYERSRARAASVRCR